MKFKRTCFAWTHSSCARRRLDTNSHNMARHGLLANTRRSGREESIFFLFFMFKFFKHETSTWVCRFSAHNGHLSHDLEAISHKIKGGCGVGTAVISLITGSGHFKHYFVE